jgi:hypothetical protein
MIKYKVIKEWETKVGLTAYAVINSMGYINGYVESPELLQGMKYYESDIDTEEFNLWTKEKVNTQLAINRIDVHGGLTYSDKPYFTEGIWVFGFDTAHSCDAPNLKLAFSILSEPNDNYEEYLKTFYRVRKATSSAKDLNYVINQCEYLAVQLNNTVWKKEGVNNGKFKVYNKRRIL